MLLIALVSFGTYECNQKQEKGKFTISGEIKNAPDQKIYLEQLFFSQKNPEVLDTAEIKNGKFSLSAVAPEEGLYRLRLEKVETGYIFINDNPEINFKADIKDISINGPDFNTPANHLFKNFITSIDTRRAELMNGSIMIDSLKKIPGSDSLINLKTNNLNELAENFKNFILKSVDTLQDPVVAMFALGYTQNIDPSLLNRAQKQIQNEIKKALNINNDLIKSSLSKINAVTCLSSVGIILEAVNLCATCAGFIIMFEKLKKISGKVDALVNTVKSSNQIQTNFELNKILSEHANMLDSRKTKNDYSEEKMRILVDDEFNVLKMLIDTFLLETTNERNNLVLSIYSLASMLTVSIMYFDELYYYNNKDRISNGEYWHSSHNRWMSELDRLSSAEFISKIQDFGFFELNLIRIIN